MGRARRSVSDIAGAQVTDEHHLEVGRVVCVHDRKMKEPWCLVASESTVGTRTLIRYYGKRWGIETSFRGICKDPWTVGQWAVHRALDAQEPRARDRAGPAGADVCAGAHRPWRRGVSCAVVLSAVPRWTVQDSMEGVSDGAGDCSLEGACPTASSSRCPRTLRCTACATVLDCASRLP